MKCIASLALGLLLPLVCAQDLSAPAAAADDTVDDTVDDMGHASPAVAGAEPIAERQLTPGSDSPVQLQPSAVPDASGSPAADADSSGLSASGSSAGDEAAFLPVEILMADKELALSDSASLARAVAAAGAFDEGLPRHVAVVQRFNEDMQLLATLLLWVESKDDADRIAAPAGVLCRRGVELVTYFEEEIAPQLTQEEQRELSEHVTSEQKRALSQVFQTLMGMMQSGFFGSEDLSRATAPLLKSMLGVPSP